jgi:Xaa-Pro aminopeptidase
MDKEKQLEFDAKLQRIFRFIDGSPYEAVVIGTQTNFSWLSCGGSSRVVNTSDISAAYLVITKETRTVVAYTMDGPRNLDEELQGMGFEPVFINWIDGSLEERVHKLLKGRKALADIAIEGADIGMQAFYALHYPFTKWDIERTREIHRGAEKLLGELVGNFKPGMLETEIENLINCEFMKAGYFPVVVLIGSDERITKYRHLTAQPKKIDKYLLIILAMRKYGLNAVLTRSVYFGDEIPEELARKYDAASTIAANCIAHSVPGTKFHSILAMQKELYKELGFEDEWKNHFQGGITGYIPNDSSLCLDAEAEMVEDQTYNWFVTITGVNTEDVYLSRKTGGEILTITGAWPLKAYETRNGKVIELPQIMKVRDRD